MQNEIRAARMGLGLEREDLAKAANLSVSTIYRIEGPNPGDVKMGTMNNIKGALEVAGAVFNGDGSVTVPCKRVGE